MWDTDDDDDDDDGDDCGVNAELVQLKSLFLAVSIENTSVICVSFKFKCSSFRLDVFALPHQNYTNNVYTSVRTMKNAILWDVKPCGS
jgi:hypothetical protein